MTQPTSALSEAYRAAHDAYLAEHPEPTDLDFACPWCKAQPGEPCCRPELTGPVPGRSKYHLARHERTARAFNKRVVASIDAGEAAEDAELAAQQKPKKKTRKR